MTFDLAAGCLATCQTSSVNTSHSQQSMLMLRRTQLAQDPKGRRDK